MVVARLRHFVPRTTLLNIYQSLLLAYLTYGLAAWGQAAKTYLQKILVLQKRVLRFIKAGVIDCSVSDHDIIFADLRLKASRPKVTYVKTRSFKSYNPDAFQYDMSFAPWSVLEIFDDIDDKLHAFDLLFNEILDHHAPIRSIKVHGKQNPCITEETRKLMKSRTIGAREHTELIIPLTGLLTKTLNTK